MQVAEVAGDQKGGKLARAVRKHLVARSPAIQDKADMIGFVSFSDEVTLRRKLTFGAAQAREDSLIFIAQLDDGDIATSPVCDDKSRLSANHHYGHSASIRRECPLLRPADVQVRRSFLHQRNRPCLYPAVRGQHKGESWHGDLCSPACPGGTSCGDAAA